MKISQESVLHVSNAKISKTDEKRTKFAKLAVSVPQLLKVVKSSPWLFQKLEKVTKGPFKLKSDIISPLVQSFTKCQV